MSEVSKQRVSVISYDSLDPYRHALTIREALNLLGISTSNKDKISCLDPAHDDSDPSMQVYDDHLYCFGCSRRLDLIDLVKEVNGCSFREALDWIATKANLPSPNFNSHVEFDQRARQDIAKTYEEVFQASLVLSDTAATYLYTNRGIQREVCHGLVGYLPSDYSHPDRAACEKAGLISGSGRFLFAGYMVFPIRRNGKIEDLYGRYLGDTDPQYKHRRPGTTDPQRPACFWNLDQCRTRKFEEVYLTEGVIKGLSLIAKGQENVIAMIGIRGLTESHIALLKQARIRKVVFAFDTDSNESGQKAAMDLGRDLFVNGFEVAIITLPIDDGAKKIDLDDYFLSHDLDDFDKLERRDYFSCLCDKIPKDGSVHEKKLVVISIIKQIANLGDDLLAPDLMKRLKLASGGTFPLGLLNGELKRMKGETPADDDDKKQGPPDHYADIILEREVMIFDSQTFYAYNGGVYHHLFDLEVKKMIQDLGKGKFGKYRIEDVLHSLEIKTFIRPELINKPEFLNLKSGLLDLKSGELQPHNPDFYYTVQLDVPFDPLALCPRWREFLNTVLPEKDMQLLLAQIFGYCLTADTSLHKGFLFYGQGSNGKSVVTDVLEALVGPDNCAALQMNDFKERFRIAELSNKLINVSSEVEAHGRVEDAVIKKIISGDPITTERKNKDPIKTRLFSRLIANCNQLPLSKDRSYGWFRRWIILPFKITIPEKRCDTELANRIIKEELPGVLNWALLGLTLLREKSGFSIPKSSNKALEEYKKEIDPTLVFIEDRLEFREDPLEPNRKSKAGTLLDAVYSAYRNWCETNGHKPLSSGNLASVIEKHFKIERVKKTRGKYLPEIFLTTSD